MAVTIKRNTIKTSIIKIGNSQGIRIPKLLLDQLKLGPEVELEAQDNQLIVRSTQTPRQGWEESLDEMVRNGDDRLLDAEPFILTQVEKDEWEW